MKVSYTKHRILYRVDCCGKVLVTPTESMDFALSAFNHMKDSGHTPTMFEASFEASLGWQPVTA